MIAYKKLTEQDTAELLKLQKQLDCETNFMMYLPNERKATVKDTEKTIVQLQGTGLLLGAWDSDNCVGYLSAERSPFLKCKHTAYIVIGITKACDGQGIGTKLFQELEAWAKKQGVHRLELTVMVHNTSGRKLYEKMGFLTEGVKRDAIHMEGTFFDEYYMAKLL